MEMIDMERHPYASRGLIGPLGDVSAWKLIGVCALFGITLWNLVTLDSDKEKVALDLQVYVKLAMVGVAGIYGAVGFLTEQRVRQVALSFPLAWILLIACLYTVSSVFSVTPVPALASTISIFCVYLLTITMVVELGRENVVKVLFGSMGVFMIGSWVAFFFVPEIGVFEEPLADGEFAIRMSGITHPNSLGQHAGFCLISGAALWFGYRQRNFLIPFICLLAVGALISSLSRTAIAATVFAFAVGFRHRILTGSVKSLLVPAGMVLFLGLIVLATQVDFSRAIERQLGAVSKSGDSDEITTATGRGEIWTKTISLIKERPFIGYGPTTSKFLLGEYSLYTHNLLLNICLLYTSPSPRDQRGSRMPSSA